MNGTDLELTDTHCHLTVEQLEAETEALLLRARSAGVTRLVVPGVDLETSRSAVLLAEREPDVYAAVGVHPHYADQWSDQAQAEIEQLAKSPAVVAVGEIGLDYYRDLAPRQAQQRALVEQLALARKAGKPVIIHNREATQDLLRVLLEWAASLGPQANQRAGVLHAFSAELPDAEAAIDAGFYIGVAGPVTFPNANALRDTLKQLPLERLLIETDSPYLAPQPRRGKRNEPAFLPFVADGLAEALQLNPGEAARSTSHNASTLFRLTNGNQDPQLH